MRVWLNGHFHQFCSLRGGIVVHERIQEREQKPKCAEQHRKTEGNVAEGRRELAHLIGRLLARRWLKEQRPPAWSTRSMKIGDDGPFRDREPMGTEKRPSSAPGGAAEF